MQANVFRAFGWPGGVLALLLAVAMPPSARAEEEIPLVGRPADVPFSGASAPFAVVQPGPQYRVPFEVKVSASPRRLEALTPLTYTVAITAHAPVRSPPSRIDLNDVPAFKRAFFIEDVTDGLKEQIGDSEWRWVYRLKPRDGAVDEIPGLPFVFYNPDLQPSEKAFQVIYTDSIPLTVAAVEPLPPPLHLPDAMLEVAGGPGVLAQRSPWRMPGPVVLGLLLSGPPLACVCWYRLWRRWYPDAGRQSRLRRSRAAHRALSSLKAAPAEPGQARGDCVAGAIAGYTARAASTAAPEEANSARIDGVASGTWFARRNWPKGPHACCARARPPMQVSARSSRRERSRRTSTQLHSRRGGPGMIMSLLTAVALTLPAAGDLGNSELMRKAEEEFIEGLRRREARDKSRAQFRRSAEAYEELLRRGAKQRVSVSQPGQRSAAGSDLPGAHPSLSSEGLRVAPRAVMLLRGSACSPRLRTGGLPRGEPAGTSAGRFAAALAGWAKRRLGVRLRRAGLCVGVRGLHALADAASPDDAAGVCGGARRDGRLGDAAGSPAAAAIRISPIVVAQFGWGAAEEGQRGVVPAAL